MKTDPISSNRKRNALLLLPLPVAICLTALFWSLGGGSSGTAHAMPSQKTELNALLPAAYFDENDTWDKFKLYERASYDSAKFEEARESDPYFDLATFKTKQQDKIRSTGKLVSEFKRKDPYALDANEDKVNRKIEELYRQINDPLNNNNNQSTTPSPARLDSSASDSEFSSDVTRLERMMEDLHSQRQADPEMQQIENMLEKILDIQHPERVQQKLAASSKTSPASSVTLASNDVAVGNLDKAHQTSLPSHDPIQPSSNGFFGLEDGLSEQQAEENIIPAVIHHEQQLVSGATVKLRLADNIIIDGYTLERDAFIYGTCNITGERLTIDINSIHVRGTLLKVSLKVYDLDGIEGVYVPGAIARDVAKQSSDNAMQGISFMSVNPTIGAQAAAAGVEAAKGLFSKKAKLIKVTVTAGYQVLLKNTSTTASY